MNKRWIQHARELHRGNHKLILSQLLGGNKFKVVFESHDWDNHMGYVQIISCQGCQDSNCLKWDSQ